jgi:Zn-finger nucleic acid-binding protein
VWLDRGELDKLIERAIGNNPTISTSAAPAAPVAPQPQVIHDDKYGRPYKKSKTKSILGEIFDF